MRTPLKHLIVMLAVVATAGMALQAQPRGRDRLPRILDPLGILPTPRQVLGTLDHVTRVLPPVVIETRGYPIYEDDCDYRGHPVREGYGRRVYAEVVPFYPYRAHGRYGHREYRREAWRGHGHDRGQHRGWR